MTPMAEKLTHRIGPPPKGALVRIYDKEDPTHVIFEGYTTLLSITNEPSHPARVALSALASNAWLTDPPNPPTPDPT